MSKSSDNLILIVDDDPLHREMLTKVLSNKGYSVTATEEVMEALLEIASKNIDLIISDIEMPTVTGFQLKKFLTRKKISIPVVFLSSHDGMGIQLMGEELGAVAFLSKPVDSVDLLETVGKILAGT
ncbi:MAG: response regulator [Bacteroidota bacterium]|nr:response regulator [Bacteroidota bacterium]